MWFAGAEIDAGQGAENVEIVGGAVGGAGAEIDEGVMTGRVGAESGIVREMKRR